MTSKEKRLLTVTGTFLTIVVIGVLTLVPYVRKWQFYDKTIAERQTNIHSYKRQIANKPLLLEEIGLVDGLMTSSDLFIRAANKAAASSVLLAAVKTLVEKSGGQITSINTLNLQKQNVTTNAVAVKVNFIAENNTMVKVLKQLAASKPLLNVTTARITPLLRRQRNQDIDTGKVRIDFVIEAFYIEGGQG